MVRRCMELPYSSIRHFPAGTYEAQTETHAGRLEMEVMSVVQQAWYMFQHLKTSDWKEPELRFAKWMDSRPPEPEPTRRLDEIVSQLWGVPFWVLRLWRVGDKRG